MVQNLEGLLTALFECASVERDATTKEAISASMRSLGVKQPQLLLRTVHSFLAKHNKLAGSSRAFLLSLLNQVLNDVLDTVDEELASLIVNLATQEMTMSKEVEEEWQEAASDVLVTLGKRFCTQVMDALLQKFQPGFQPHSYVLRTLGDIAVSNVFGFVPFLSDVMSRTVPMLNSVKSDSMKAAYASAIRHFCEAVREYVANIKDAPDPSVGKNVYAGQMEAAYDAVYPWLGAKDYKVRTTVAECLGELCHIIAPSRVHEELRKLIPAMLALYKKSSIEPYSVTQGLCRLLEAACADETCPLDSYLEEILTALFPQVCEDVDYSASSAVKNRNEVFRCFHVCASRFADRLVYYLLQKMQSGQEKFKLGAISVMRHLINASGPYIVDKRSLVILGMKPALNEQNSVRVKKALCQLCVALADHGYVDAEGGEQVIVFLVRNLVPIDDSTKKQTVEVDPAAVVQLRTQCGQALQTIAKTCTTAHKLLWPYLFEFLCMENYTTALPELCRCVTILARRKIDAGEEMDFEKGFSDNPRVPGRHQVFCRLLVALNGPLDGNSKRAQEGLKLLVVLAPWFHASVAGVVGSRSEQLEKTLDEMCAMENTAKAQKRWENEVLKLLAAFVTSVSEGDWRSSLAAVMGKQLGLYNNYPDEKRFLLRCMGGVLSKIANAQFVVDHLDLMFKSVNHAVPKERNGCASAVGFCASVHTELVLTKLENIAKWEFQKKTGGFLGFIKDSIPMKSESDVEMTNLRATIMLSYGYLIYYCPIDTVTQRLEATVMRFLKPYLESAKQEAVVKEALLETIDLIAVSAHPVHLNADYTFPHRGALLNNIKEYLQPEVPEAMTNSVRVLAAKATASLAKLCPPLSEAELWSASGVLARVIFPLTAARVSKQLVGDSREVTVDSALSAFYGALEQIVKKQPTVATVATLTKMLSGYYASALDHERERSMLGTLVVLKVYFENSTDCALGRASEFSPLASLLARLVPRFGDSSSSVRASAGDATHWTLRLAYLHQGHAKDAADILAQSVAAYRSELVEANDIQAQLQLVSRLAEVIEQRLPKSQIQTYLSVIFEMILDKQTGVSCASAILLRQALSCRGDQLQNESEILISTLLLKLPDVQSVQTYTEVLSSLVAFAQHHLSIVVDILIKQPLPYSQSTVDAWHTLARDASLLPGVIDYILERLAAVGDSPYELIDGSSIKYAKIECCSLTSAFSEVVKAGEPEDVITSRVPRLLAAILLHLGALVDTHFPLQNTGKQISADLRTTVASPASLALQSVKTLLLRVRADMVIHEINEARAWNDFIDPQHFVTSIGLLSKSLAEHRPVWVRPLTDLLSVKLDTPNEAHRTVAVAVLASFVRLHPDQEGHPDTEHLEILVNALMKGLADTSIRIRKLSVRGMGDIALVSDAELEKYTTTAVSAVMAGLEDPGDHRDEVALEAMNGLNKLSARVARRQLESILVNVLLRLRPCFEKESGALRAVSFSLFGELAKAGDCDAYREQIHTNMIALLLHLHDEQAEVQKMCSRALIAIAPLLNSDDVSRVINRDLKPYETPRSYHTFLKEFCHVLALAFPDRVNYYALCCNNYFKSGSSRIRANAAYLTGYLLGGLPSDLRSTISKELIFVGLALLLKEPEVEVKVATADAIACLHAYY